MAASEVFDVNDDERPGGGSGVDVFDNSEQPLDADSQVFRSTIIGSINALKEDVSNLKDDMRQIIVVSSLLKLHASCIPGVCWGRCY